MRRRPAPARGVSLIELLVVVVVAGILLGVAVPGFQSQIARSRLEGATTELAQDLYQARSEALRRSTVVRLATRADGQGYTLARDSTTTKTRTLPAGVTMSANEQIDFDPLRGTTLDGDRVLDVTTSAGGLTQTLRASITAVGRVRLCAPSGGMPGYPTCA